MVDTTTMSITNIACFKAEGEVTIKFAGEVTLHATTSPPSTAPGGSPPPPAGGSPPPLGDAATPPSPPGRYAPPCQDHDAGPSRLFVRNETVDAVNNLMVRFRQDESDRAAMELGRVNRHAHQEIERVTARIARLEHGDTSHSKFH